MVVGGSMVVLLVPPGRGKCLLAGLLGLKRIGGIPQVVPPLLSTTTLIAAVDGTDKMIIMKYRQKLEGWFGSLLLIALKPFFRGCLGFREKA